MNPILAGLVAVAVAMLPPAPALAQAADMDREVALPQRAPSPGATVARPVERRVIVRLRGSGPDRVASAAAIAGAQDRVARRLWNLGHSMPGWHAFRAIPAVTMEVDPASQASLLADPEIEGIEEDRLARPGLSTSVPLVAGPTAWDLGYTGQGVAVAILDTGVDGSHAFFGGRVVAEACFSTTLAAQRATSLCPDGTDTQTGTGAAAACSIDGCFHGTHVAGIAAGFQSTSFAGVARNARIIAIQVFSRFDDTTICDGAQSCILSYTSDQIRALDYVLQLRASFTIGAVNMSLGGGGQTSQAACDLANASTKRAVDALRAVGIPTVISSGNDGYVNAVSEPGCISTAISVGNTTNADAIHMPSNIASFVTLMAPGSSIRSALAGGSFGFASGTSMSAPHVAGALAVLRQANATATVSELITALRSGGRSLSFRLTGSSGTTYSYTIPRLDVVGALAIVCPTCIVPANGWWWNASEAGRGFSIEVRQGRIFLGSFLYDDDGSPVWYVMNGAQGSAGFSASLAKFGQGQTLSSAWRPAAPLGTVGTATVSFASPTAGTLVWPGGTVAISRFAIDGSSVALPQSGSPETGWWWNESEPGTGWFFEVQGSNMFLAGYLYDDGGRPVWYVAAGAMLTAAAFDGDLQIYGGGQTLTGSYRAPTSTAAVGRISVRFAGATSATVTLPSGRTVSLTRFSGF